MAEKKKRKTGTAAAKAKANPAVEPIGSDGSELPPPIPTEPDPAPAATPATGIRKIDPALLARAGKKPSVDKGKAATPAAPPKVEISPSFEAAIEAAEAEDARDTTEISVTDKEPETVEITTVKTEPEPEAGHGDIPTKEPPTPPTQPPPQSDHLEEMADEEQSFDVRPVWQRPKVLGVAAVALLVLLLWAIWPEDKKDEETLAVADKSETSLEEGPIEDESSATGAEEDGVPVVATDVDTRTVLAHEAGVTATAAAKKVKEVESKVVRLEKEVKGGQSVAKTELSPPTPASPMPSVPKTVVINPCAGSWGTTYEEYEAYFLDIFKKPGGPLEGYSDEEILEGIRRWAIQTGCLPTSTS